MRCDPGLAFGLTISRRPFKASCHASAALPASELDVYPASASLVLESGWAPVGHGQEQRSTRWDDQGSFHQPKSLTGFEQQHCSVRPTYAARCL
jgi:hypothetical protein